MPISSPHSQTRRASLALATAAAILAAALPAAAQTTPAPAGGRLVWAYLQRAQSLDPNIWSGGSDTVIMRQMFDPLVWSPRPGEYVPGLATSWTISPDGRTYTFKLRDDVKFHDGTPFTAEAVKFTFERIANPENKSLLVGAIGPFESAEAIDRNTVAIRLKAPWGAFMANLSAVALSPTPPEAVRRLGPQFAQNPVGTGPFMFDKWVGNDIHLKRNPDYAWAPSMATHQGKAHLDEIVIREVPEASTRVNALRTGEVNFTHFPVLSQVEGLERAGFQVVRVPQPGFAWSLPMNVQRPPTDDIRVRRAIIHALNRDQIVRSVLFNQFKVAHSPLTAVTFGYDSAVQNMYPYDLARAGALLDEAGWKLPPGGKIREKNGEKLRIEMIMFDTSTNKQVTELAQAMLQQAGFEANLAVTNYPAFAARVSAADYNLAQMRWSALDPDQVIPTMFSSGQVTGGGQFNRTRIALPDLDRTIAEAGASTDVATRRRIYGEVQQTAMREAWIAPIYDDTWFWLAQPAVKGLTMDIEGRPLFYNVSIAR
jgi:peptide/nickel transport system substrate-binding protein